MNPYQLTQSSTSYIIKVDTQTKKLFVDKNIYSINCVDEQNRNEDDLP